MLKGILVFVSMLGLLAILAGLTVQAFAQSAALMLVRAAEPDLFDAEISVGDVTNNSVIPPADLWQVLRRARFAKAHAASEMARVQSVIDYIKTNNRFPPRTRPFDSAQQVVMDYIRVNNRVPPSAAQVNAPAQAVIDYIRVHNAMPAHPEPIDPAIQDVMDYIRIYNRVPSSANVFQ